ncbi:hypothetical protein [Pseudomonas abietaniphila]|uniref:hypothetical protein n=1 Tax=Pseudomonas abietaniphila TaxID=89065 RepID=UPI0007858E6E|nr:hypothetical protein [Pseudomonas abietaniphila]
MHSAISKTHFNGYDVINVNNGPWRVCTHHDRLGSFDSREEAMAFAASLPAYQERTAMSEQPATAAKAKPTKAENEAPKA